MIEAQYNLQFEKLCNKLKLGNILNIPQSVSGGLLHRMFKVKTTQGEFAIKALNPQIMLRPQAMMDIINSEKIASISSKKISAMSSNIYNGTNVQELDNQFYLIYDWIDGKSLKQDEINITHCSKIGSILAELHNMDFLELKLVDNYSSHELLVDWNFYLEKGIENKSVWVEFLRENIDNLNNWNKQLIQSAEAIHGNTVISHGDLDPKNIMWRNETPILIDWESAGFINPIHDLLDTAIYWAKNEVEDVDKEKFMAFINAYKQKFPELKADWETVLLRGFSGKIYWLEYSLKRSLWIECNDESEQKMGTEHVTGTLYSLKHHANIIVKLAKWLNEM